ncbi:hypothetical protein DMENIID0001_095630 [Sergentomyia squamirostris]
MNTRSKISDATNKAGEASPAPSPPANESIQHDEPQGAAAAANTERPPSCQTIRSSSMEEDFVESPPRSTSVPPSAPPSDAGHGDAMLTIDRRTRNLPDLTNQQMKDHTNREEARTDGPTTHHRVQATIKKTGKKEDHMVNITCMMRKDHTVNIM